MGGFSYRGKNIDAFGEIWYAPELSARSDYAPPFKVTEDEINGRDGAYIYGSRVPAREFTLRCYYEGLTQGDKEDIMRWFARGTKGALVFDDRPWVRYDVTPNERVTFEDYKGSGCMRGRYMGVQKIPLVAAMPFGKLTVCEPASVETLILAGDMAPSATYDPSQASFLIYNPGTEKTPLTIEMAGAAEAGVIMNEANGTKCRILGMTKAATTDAGKTLRIDGETGRVTLESASASTLAFEMHDFGYIALNPCSPFERAVAIGYTSGSDVITSALSAFNEDMVGLYVYLGNAWHEIIAFTDERHVRIATPMGASGTETTPVCGMNRITMSGFTLDSLDMTFTPRVR